MNPPHPVRVGQAEPSSVACGDPTRTGDTGTLAVPCGDPTPAR